MANPTSSAKQPKKRPYDSALRAEQALATRRRIRDAADERFRSDGYRATSMDDVAKAAGVSRQTVFSAFGSKAKLLKEVLDVRIVGDDAPLSVDEREHVARMLAEPDPVEILRLNANLTRYIGEGISAMWDIFEEAAAVEPSLAEERARGDAARREGVGLVPVLLAERGALSSRWTVEHAGDALWLLNGPGPGMAARSRGWSWDLYERWLFETSAGLLLDGPVPAWEPLTWPEDRSVEPPPHVG